MTIKEAAAQFGNASRFGGWWLGYLVAACVEKGKGQGKKPLSNRKEVAKVSAAEFARMSKTSAARVLRYLDAWEKAAEAGIVPAADGLTLASRFTLTEDLPEWTEFYTSVSGGYNGGTDRQPTAKQAAAVLSQLPPDTAAHVIADAVENEDIQDAIAEDEEVQDRILDATLTSTHGKSGGKKVTRKKNRSMDEMLVTLELIGVLGKIRELARTDADSPLIIECKNLMRETLEILDGLAEADDPESIEKMLDDFGDLLARQ